MSESISSLSFIKEESRVSKIVYITSKEEYLTHLETPLILGNCSKSILGIDTYKELLVSRIKDYQFESDFITLGSGLLLSECNSLAKKVMGENFNYLMTIPGTVGGALVTNASYLNECISDTLVQVTGYDYHGNYRLISKNDLIFKYRYCDILKHLKFITSATFKVHKSDIGLIEERERKALEYRSQQPKGILTLGSTFKNPADNKAYEVIKKTKLGNYDSFKISSKHANFLEFKPFVKGEKIKSDLLKMRSEIAFKSGLDLEFEILFLEN